MNPDTSGAAKFVRMQKCEMSMGTGSGAFHEIDTRKGQNTTPKSTAYEVARSMVDQMKKAT